MEQGGLGYVVVSCLGSGYSRSREKMRTKWSMPRGAAIGLGVISHSGKRQKDAVSAAKLGPENLEIVFLSEWELAANRSLTALTRGRRLNF